MVLIGEDISDTKFMVFPSENKLEQMKSRKMMHEKAFGEKVGAGRT